MKLPAAHLLAPAVCAVFAIAGWQAGGEKPDAPALTSTAAAAPRQTRRSHRISGPRDMPADVRERMARIHAARTPEDRLRATIQLAQSLPVSELERWYVAEWFDFHETMDSNVFYKITRGRWLAEDPAGLMAYSLRYNSDKTGEMAGLWAKQDPGAALKLLEETKNPADLQRLASAMAGPLAEADPAGAIAQVLKLQTMLGSQQEWAISQMIGELAKHSPELLKSESTEWPASLQRIAASQLIAASLERDFTSGVAGLRDAPDGKKRFLDALESNSELVKEMAKNPNQLPPGWFAAAALANSYYLVYDEPAKWLGADLAALGFNEQQAKGLRSSALGFLGSKDPERAMEMLAGDDLDANQRRNLLLNGLSSLARKDQTKAEEWIARLTDPKEIAQAREAMDQASVESPAKTPPTPADWLAGLDGKDPNSMWQYNRLTRSWDREQVAAAVSELRELPDAQKSATAAKLVTGEDGVPLELRAEAITQMLENPPPPDPNRGEPNSMTRHASGLVSSWGRKDPVAAGRWVNSLPSGEARLWAAKNLAAQWNEYEPAAARQWTAGLPADERNQVQAYLDSGAAGKP